METILTLDHFSKVYRNGRGAKNITFSVERGEVVGLLGPNGSGKTTIMKAITGLTQPTDGLVEIFGAEVSTRREQALSKVGALIEQPALYESLSAWDHLAMAARYYPQVAKAMMISRISTVASMSKPLVGSSRTKSSGSESRAKAKPRRCFMPRENFPQRSLA